MQDHTVNVEHKGTSTLIGLYFKGKVSLIDITCCSKLDWGPNRNIDPYTCVYLNYAPYITYIICYCFTFLDRLNFYGQKKRVKKE